MTSSPITIEQAVAHIIEQTGHTPRTGGRMWITRKVAAGWTLERMVSGYKRAGLHLIPADPVQAHWSNGPYTNT